MLSFWNVKIVVFAEYVLDDFVSAEMFIVLNVVINNDELNSLLINNSFCLLNLIELVMQMLNFIFKRFDCIGGFRWWRGGGSDSSGGDIAFVVFWSKCGGYELRVEDSGFPFFNLSTNGMSFEKLSILSLRKCFCFWSFPGPVVCGKDSMMAGWLNGVNLLTLIFTSFVASVTLVFFLFPVLLVGFFGFRSFAGISVYRWSIAICSRWWWHYSFFRVGRS